VKDAAEKLSRENGRHELVTALDEWLAQTYRQSEFLVGKIEIRRSEFTEVHTVKSLTQNGIGQRQIVPRAILPKIECSSVLRALFEALFT
jgi:cephalosporin-C deacetylase-like acetyl esterase